MIRSLSLLSKKDFKPFYKNSKINGVFNPAAIRRKDGKIILFARVSESPMCLKNNEYIFTKKGVLKTAIIDELKIKKTFGNVILLKDGSYKLTNISTIRKILLNSSGTKIEKIIQKPLFFSKKEYEDLGIEDPRIVKVGSRYLMSYVAVCEKNGVSTILVSSKDLKKWKILGKIFSDENKDVVLFPEKVQNKYVALQRPFSSFILKKQSIFISYSEDLVNWKNRKILISPRINSWEQDKIGSGPPPIKTKNGWLLIYHGVKNNIYSAGAVLLDLKNPEKILARSSKNIPLLNPINNIEKNGFVNNVIFPTGIVLDKKNDDILLYCGASDQYIELKRLKLSEILKSLVY